MSPSVMRVMPAPREPNNGFTTMSPPSSSKALMASVKLSVTTVRGDVIPAFSRSAEV